jgi:peptidoglycan/LPS O-acetylase OafA/YrhL
MSWDIGTSGADVRHRPELDGLRGLAILLVVMHHSGWLPGGWIGVDLFFALSGYLITSLLMSEMTATGTVRMPAFYRRRAARLAPALLVALPAAALLHDDAFGALAVLLYVANFALAFAPTGLATTWGWSLSLEEQFYLLWPALLRGLLPRLGARRLGGLLVGAALTVALVRLVVSARTGYALVRGDDILLGCSVALLALQPRRWMTIAAAAAFAACTAAALTPASVMVVIPVAAAASAVLVGGAADLRVLGWRPLRHAGRVSYSWYLWDGILSSTPGVARALLSLALAEASTWLLERPARRWVMSLRRRPVLAVAPSAA